MIAFLTSRIGKWLAIAGGAILAFLTLRWKFRADGARDERQRATNADRSRADEIRNRVRDAADSVSDSPPDRIFRD